MRTVGVAGVIVALAVSGNVLGANERGKVEINKDKREGTINASKDGTLKGGLAELPKKPESSLSEKDRRDQQRESGGQVFIRKTF